MAFLISYSELFLIITALWIFLRIIFAVKNKAVCWKYELKLLSIYICIVVIVRLVCFPLSPSGGQMEKLLVYTTKDVWNRLNLIPFAFMVELYDGWEINFFGNIAMFIPLGMALPFCFEKMDNIKTVTLAGFLSSLFIEISQMFMYNRGTDVDDLITNTLGAFIGAFLYFYFFKRNAVRYSVPERAAVR